MKQVAGTLLLAAIAAAISMAVFVYAAGSKDAVSPDFAITDS